MGLNGEQIEMQLLRRRDGEQGMPVQFEEWEALARERVPRGPYDYIAGGAGAEDTMRANLEAFQRCRLRPRVMLRDVSERDLSVTLFGKKLPAPFLLAPVGVLSIVHPDAELAPARAAAATGIPLVLSNMATQPMEAVAGAMGDSPRWFQLYPPKTRELTRSLVRRAERAGYDAIVLTLDSPLLGWRPRDLRNGYLPFLSGEGLGNYLSDPVFQSLLEKPIKEDPEAAINRALAEGNNTRFDWNELAFIRQETKLPLLLKGMTHPEDVDLALMHGVDGLIISNHGGRQLDGAVSTLDQLVPITDIVRGRVPVLLDSGIRRGADVLKALALGAAAVLIGRPYAYALAVAGEQGVRAVIEHLYAEIDLQLGVAGHKCIAEVSRSLVQKVDCYAR